MRLRSIDVQNYKVIDATGPIPIDNAVTALVGKNESGKTAILRALWKSKNVAGEQFDKLFDYPIDRYSKERKGTQKVTVLEFDLEDSEAQELAKELPEESSEEPRTVTYTTSYEGEEHSTTDVSFGEAIKTVCFRPAKDAYKAIEKVAKSVRDVTSDNQDEQVQAACATALEEIESDGYLWAETTLKGLREVKAALDQWIAQDPEHENEAVDARTELENILGRAEEGDPLEPAQEWLREKMPAFIYFDDYGQLETRINLPTYLLRVSKPDRRTRTQTALFEWSDLDPDEILHLGRAKEGHETEDDVQRRKDKRKRLLDSASFSLTGDWEAWWSDKSHRLHIEADGDDLVLRVSDEHNRFPIPFEERSHGFQWFFSFYLVFLVESKKAHKGAILLLDEPGLHLHPTLQTKLVDFFERVSESNQLIYSTHLPFLVDGNHLERVRTVHLHGPEPQKTMVSNDIRPTGDRETLFPLQAALGYSIAQTLFLGKRVLIVEGITDYWLLKSLDACLAGMKLGPGLHGETVLVPAGGTSRLMPLASIMFSTTGVDQRRMLVLLDSDTAGGEAAKRLLTALQGSAPILLLGEAIEVEQATIEDLVPRDDYVAAVRTAGYQVKLNTEEAAEVANVKALEKAFARMKLGSFGTEQKAQAALKLVETWGAKPETVPEVTREKALALFSAINTRLEETR